VFPAAAMECLVCKKRNRVKKTHYVCMIVFAFKPFFFFVHVCHNEVAETRHLVSGLIVFPAAAMECLVCKKRNRVKDTLRVHAACGPSI